MSANTKIVVLKMKNIIITLLFASLSIILILLLIFMFKGKNTESVSTSAYIPGVYSSTITLNNQELDVEVLVSADEIRSIRFVNLSETVTTMFPLMESALESVSVQIIQNQSTTDLLYADDMKYTSQLLVGAIEEALAKAENPNAAH
jgi:uncharacterized protein with FMN-binding domain